MLTGTSWSDCSRRLAVTTICSDRTGVWVIATFSVASFPSSTMTSARVSRRYPTIEKMSVHFPGDTAAMRYSPFVFVMVPRTVPCRSTVTPTSGSESPFPVTRPAIEPPEAKAHRAETASMRNMDWSLIAMV